MTKLMTSVMWMQTRPAGLAEVMLVVRGVQSQRSVDCLNEFIRMRVALVGW